MRKFGGFLWIIFLIMLLSPGYAVANGQFLSTLYILRRYRSVTQFTVDVNIVAMRRDPASLCGWQYTLDYDHRMLELISVAGALRFFSP